MNNSSQSQEGCRDGFLFQASGFSSDLWIWTPVRWSLVSSSVRGDSVGGRLGRGEAAVDLQSLTWLPHTLL